MDDWLKDMPDDPVSNDYVCPACGSHKRALDEMCTRCRWLKRHYGTAYSPDRIKRVNERHIKCIKCNGYYPADQCEYHRSLWYCSHCVKAIKRAERKALIEEMNKRQKEHAIKQKAKEKREKDLANEQARKLKEREKRKKAAMKAKKGKK